MRVTNLVFNDFRRFITREHFPPHGTHRCRQQCRPLARQTEPAIRLEGDLLHRNVGALQLLRHARAAGAVSRQFAGLLARQRARAVRPLHRPRLFHADDRRRPGGPLPGQAPRGRDRWHGDDAGPHRDGLRAAAARGAGPADRRQRPVQAEHDVDGRRSVRGRERPAPCGRLFDLLHGCQPRCLPGPAGGRHPGRDGRLALRFRRGRGGHGAGPDSVPAGPEVARPRRAEARAGAGDDGRSAAAADLDRRLCGPGHRHPGGLEVCGAGL